MVAFFYCMRGKLMSDKKIFLIGFMGVGKTYLGQMLADDLILKFYDIDLEIEKKAELPVNDIFSKFGEAKFREIESDILQKSELNGIISTGGGIVLDPVNREFLKNSENLVIWLNPSWDVIRSRIANSYRPIVIQRTEEELFQLWGDRQHLYQECADLVFEGSDVFELMKLL
jgi:shikimate kinase